MFVVELLTVRVWLLRVLPRLVQRRFAGNPVAICYFVDASGIAESVAQGTAWLAGVPVERLAFRLIEIRDEKGLLIRHRIGYQDLAEVLGDVATQQPFQELLAGYDPRSRLAAYVEKSVATISLSDRTTLWRALQLVQLVWWKNRQQPAKAAPTLVLENRAWMPAIRRYATRFGVATLPVAPAFNPGLIARRVARDVRLLRTLRSTMLEWWASRRTGKVAAAVPSPRPAGDQPRIAVQYHGQFSLSDPTRYSDVFFWQQSDLRGEDMVMLFGFPQDPLDADKWRQLQACGMSAAALYPGASKVAEVPMFVPPVQSRSEKGAVIRRNDWSSSERRWLRQTERSYFRERDFWTAVFQQQAARVYISWYRFDANHFAMADAMQSIGGVTAIYQRAYQPDASPEIAVNADIMFGYAPADAEVERRSGSVIGHHVAVGYFGDHRFEGLRPGAAQMRARLRARGAEFIIAFFDENSADDDRWHSGHQFMRANYEFLLEKLLSEPWTGLLLKPKYPLTLRRRLGPVATLLERAIATGRCHLYEEGTVNGSAPPAEAALAADIAIHGHLCAATAGLESALAGVPTLLLDREGWGAGRLHALGPNVVFTEWADLWRALIGARAQGMPRTFGDWSPMFDELDPFRDGRGAERMGTYLMWLLEGFRAGYDREIVLSQAAERYASQWGADKIRIVDGRRKPARTA